MIPEPDEDEKRPRGELFRVEATPIYDELVATVAGSEQENPGANVR
ncbi:hypothetical protein QRX60_29490 [Amycolatopsis mongoliensis]|uniref:Uncharacterized protein n=1 Tax=Amycolatopsis mongoliensis TaxID=715475 RepID=A0A9Y2NHH2_9PSEU|nr:hypothetical protein [Amycolatopsis sp. 4-36]WIX98199.1 hypothetical protein QRX60_29490 [Amycolatopsis sp. 4-36]